MKRRKRPGDPAVSLFPFLTVLICTIGMLIVLLVISVRAVGSKSQQLAEQVTEQQRAELAQLQGDLELHQLRAEGWQEIRGKRVEQIRLAREERTYLEQALRELDDEAREVAAQLEELTKAPPQADEVLELEQKLTHLQDQLAQEQQQTVEQPPAETTSVLYNLVPYNGPGGTTRRPIYVECTGQKLVLQPFGIELQLDDFAVPGEPGNPLDAALTAIKEYWRRYDLAGAEGTPYPLLVVRPSGAQSYALARRAMTSWVDEFGYELIPEDKQLVYGESDPQLAAEIRAAVEIARKDQALLAEQIQYRERVLQQRAIARQMAVGGGGGLRPDRARGGFTSDSRYASTHAQDGSGAAAVNKLLGSESGEASLSSSAEAEAGASPFQLGAASRSSNDFSASRPQTASQPESINSSEASQFAANRAATPDGSSAHTTAAASPPSRPTSTSASQVAAESGKPVSSSLLSQAAGEGGTAGLSSGNCPAPLAASRGNDWALPGRNSPRATAYLRPIKVICSADELIIVTGPQSPLNSNVISFPAETAGAVEPLVGSLWRLIDSWGPTPDNGYWKPVLKVETLPSGEARARDLKALMQDSGIELSEEASR